MSVDFVSCGCGEKKVWGSLELPRLLSTFPCLKPAAVYVSFHGNSSVVVNHHSVLILDLDSNQDEVKKRQNSALCCSRGSHGTFLGTLHNLGQFKCQKYVGVQSRRDLEQISPVKGNTSWSSLVGSFCAVKSVFLNHPVFVDANVRRETTIISAKQSNMKTRNKSGQQLPFPRPEENLF